MSNQPRADRYVERCNEGEERNAAWRALTPRQQLESLDRRLGPGVGARRQRAKLAEVKA